MSVVLQAATFDDAFPRADVVAVPTVDAHGYALAELIEDRHASLRLRNSVAVAASTGSLPLPTVGDYVDAGIAAQAMMMRHVRNFGRKSARELDALVREWLSECVADRRAEAARPAPLPERGSYLSLFSDDPVAALAGEAVLPARLADVLAQPPLASMTFAEVLVDFGGICTDMLRRRNCGRRSLDEFRRLCMRHVSLRLREAGHPDAEATARLLLAGATFHDPVPDAAGEEGRGFPGVGRASGPPAAPEHPGLDERLDWLLDQLDARTRDIVRRRNGIGREGCETLEEIGIAYSVSRERIRQIETTALKRLRSLRRRAPVRSYLMARRHVLWDRLTGRARSLRRAALPELRRDLDPYVRLAFDIEELGLETWLDLIATAFPHGWLAPGRDAAAVEGNARALEERGRLPLPFPVAGVAADVEAATLACELVLGRRVRYGYLMPGRVGARLTRAVRLHSLAVGFGRPVPLERLTAGYRGTFADDPCSMRDAEIVMDAAPHLFLEIEDGVWSAVDVGGTASRAAAADVPSDPEPEDEGTIARALQAELSRRGPTRLVDLMDDARKILPEGRSVNSIAPTLLTRRDLFVRVLPGVYALPEHPAVFAAGRPEDWPILFDDGQARFYAMARYAGEDRCVFPFWSRRAERALCRWARLVPRRSTYDLRCPKDAPQYHDCVAGREVLECLHLIRVGVAAGQVGQAPDSKERHSVHVGDLRDRRGFHVQGFGVQGVGLVDAPGEPPEVRVVDKLRSGSAAGRSLHTPPSAFRLHVERP